MIQSCYTTYSLIMSTRFNSRKHLCSFALNTHLLYTDTARSLLDSAVHHQNWAVIEAKDLMRSSEQRLCDTAGNSGVGKSAAMQNILQQQSRQGVILPVCLTFSAQTTSLATQEMIEAKVERRHRNRQEQLSLCPVQGLVTMHDDHTVTRCKAASIHMQPAAKHTACMRDHMHLICKPMLVSNRSRCHHS